MIGFEINRALEQCFHIYFKNADPYSVKAVETLYVKTEIHIPYWKPTAEKISENVHIVANDPSLAFFRIQEHVRKVIEPILDKRLEVIMLQKNLQGHCFDMEYAVRAIKDIDYSDGIFYKIQDMIKNSIFLKQQLKYEQVKVKLEKEPLTNSVYKRFSAHLTLDLPDLTDISGVMRETSYRMENIMTTGKDGTTNNVGELQRSHTTLH